MKDICVVCKKPVAEHIQRQFVCPKTILGKNNTNNKEVIRLAKLKKLS